MFLIIGIWGGKDRIYAAFKFFLYTFLGSGADLVAMIAMYVQAGTTDIPTLLERTQFESGPLNLMGWQIGGRHADAAVARFLRQLRVKIADVAGAHWLPDATSRRPRPGRWCWRRSC